MPDLRYPIGKFEWIPSKDEAEMAARRKQYIDALIKLPSNMTAAVHGLTPEQLDTPYRPKGWTVRQLVHHVPESHMNSYVRFKLALTEDNPLIKPYDEAAWAKLPDVTVTPVEVSLQLLEALHTRWVDTLRCMQPSDFGRTVRHPERGVMTLDQMLALYAWHSAHHTRHITALRERMGWNHRTATQRVKRPSTSTL